jgi:hypothetical protein
MFFHSYEYEWVFALAIANSAWQNNNSRPAKCDILQFPFLPSLSYDSEFKKSHFPATEEDTKPFVSAIPSLGTVMRVKISCISGPAKFPANCNLISDPSKQSIGTKTVM